MRPTKIPGFANGSLLVCLGCAGWFFAATARQAAPSWPGADLFKDGPPRRISIEVQREGMESLRRKPRRWVRAKVTEAGVVYEGVGLHLKGASGSFRGVDDKPALTLDFCHFNQGQKFHGLRRIHLNNSVEDPSYLNEELGGELFRKAGVPAPRVTHAVVRLNGRRLGLYVLIEGFTEDFLSCYFKSVSGDLYEPRPGHDVGRFLHRNSVRALSRGKADLKTLAEAAREPDLARRWQRLSAALDVEEFNRFMALEIMLCQGDGYCLSGNNYRVYEERGHGKILFFPHGMDRLFGMAELPWQPRMSGLVARAVVETPEGRRRYRDCFQEVLTNVFDGQALSNRVTQLISEIAPALTHAEARSLEKAGSLLQEQIAVRKHNLEWQLAHSGTPWLRFADGIAHPAGWRKAEPSAGALSEGKDSDGFPTLEIVARAMSSADWRTRVILGPGHYRFEGRVRVAGVKPLPFADHGGARLRVEGSRRWSAELTGDSGWQLLEVEFEIEQPRTEVELLCELRASTGRAWFDRGSLEVRRVP
jgi:spore coat protein H